MRNIYFARSDEAMLDLDTEDAYKLFASRVPKIEHLVRKPMVITNPRPHHYHVYIKLKKAHDFANISAFQQYLGSDIKRELADLSRIIAGASKPILLIEWAKPKHMWREPDVVCACPREWKRKKLANCKHLMAVREHRPRFGFISTRLMIMGIVKPYE